VKRIDNYWYNKNKVANSLRPVSWIFCTLVLVRKLLYALRLFRSYRSEVPVIVVGNITVGGVGKTPLVVWLARLLKERGYKPGIISRGYRGGAGHWPQQVRPDSDPYVVGDEPLLIAQRTGCPMAVGPDRVEDAHALTQFTDCDVIISDDGMQHYRLRRDIEIAVIDGTRRFGNGYCLPAGPLREPASRLKRVDFMVTNAGQANAGEYPMEMAGGILKRLDGGGDVEALTEWKGRHVHAVVGIGNPRRFFDTLRQHGMKVIEHAYPDHHHFTADEIRFNDTLPVIMTEKDAVKCRRFADERHWYYPVDAVLPEEFAQRLLDCLKEKHHG
jgi:tetraacyldisaccharide 4'-kinase